MLLSNQKSEYKSKSLKKKFAEIKKVDNESDNDYKELNEIDDDLISVLSKKIEILSDKKRFAPKVLDDGIILD